MSYLMEREETIKEKKDTDGPHPHRGGDNKGLFLQGGKIGCVF